MTAGSTQVTEAVHTNNRAIGEPVRPDAPAEARRLRVAEPVDPGRAGTAETVNPRDLCIAKAVLADTGSPNNPDPLGVRR
jgi:hypothetical protein